MTRTVSFYNYDSNLIKVSYTGGTEAGIDRFYKKTDISFVNNGDWITLKTPTESVGIEYAKVSTTNPARHTNSLELIAVLETWLTLNIDKISGADTFSRQRSVEFSTVFDSVFKASVEPRKYYQVTGTGATIAHNAFEECVELTVPTTSSSYAIYQTRPYFDFSEGCANVARFSCILRSTANVSNNAVRVGMFDDNNNKGVTGDTGGSGCFFQLNSSGVIAVVTRNFTGGVQSDTVVTSSGWNIDRLDGYGVSGITLDVTKINTYIIEYSAEGAGTIRFGIMSRSKIWYCHEIDSTNSRTSAPLESTKLPFRAESQNTGVSGASSLTRLYSVNIAIEGEKYSQFYIGKFIANSYHAAAVKQFTATNNAGIVLSIAPGARCRDRVKIISSSFAPLVNTYFRVRLVLNGTLGGTTTWVAVTDSAIRYSITNTTCTGGTSLYEIYMFGNDRTPQFFVEYPREVVSHMFGAFDGVNGDTITLCVDNDLGAPNVNTWFTINWIEYY